MVTENVGSIVLRMTPVRNAPVLKAGLASIVVARPQRNLARTLLVEEFAWVEELVLAEPAIAIMVIFCQ